MDRLAGVLHGRVAQHRDLAGVGIDLHVDDVSGQRGAGAGGIHTGTADDGTPCLWRPRRHIRQRHAQLRVLRMCQDPRLKSHQGGVALPDRRGALRQLTDHVPGGSDGGVPRLESDATAPGVGCLADRVGVGHRGAHILDGHTHDLGELLRHRGAGAADIG